MRIEQIDLDSWGDTLPDSGFEVFHTPQALEVIDDHTDASMVLYGAFKGQEPIGLFPVFDRSISIGRRVTSPPPSMGIPRLGPLVMPTSPKQRKRESVNKKFVEQVLDELDVDSSRTLLHLVCPEDYGDPRPFQWTGMNINQRFTYVLDLSSTTADQVLDGFSRSLRKDILDAQDLDFTITKEGTDAAELIYDDIAKRYEECEDSFPVGRAFFLDIVDQLEDRSRVYVARGPDGEYLSGIVALYSNDRALFWQGGVRVEYENVSVNSTLHWEIISDVLSGDAPDVSGYDLVGANTPRLCRYKAQFSGDLVPYYTVESSGIEMSVAKRFYSLINK